MSENQEIHSEENPKQTSLTAMCVLELLTVDQQFELYKLLQEKVIEPDDCIRNKISEIESKYCDLVWLTRSDSDSPDIVKIRDTVSMKYPGELEKLKDEEQGDWTHGFNSGMLACARLLYPYSNPYNHNEIIDDDWTITRSSEIKYAEEMFPYLDT